jgi:hypothetical protein
MHGLIAVNIMVGFFTMAMFVAYLSFMPPDTTERLIARLRSRLAATKVPSSGDLTAATSSSRSAP